MRLGRRLQIVIGIGMACFGLAQLVQPEIETRSTRAPMVMPADVEATLRSGCFDCHSNETNLLWFDRIAPGSWLVARDVRRGRAVLNFSEIGQRPKPEQRGKLFEAIAMISGDVMPPKPYRALHSGAVVSSGGLEAMKRFAASLAEPSVSGDLVTVKIPAVTALAALNGVAYPTDIESWTPLQLSERWDNGTVRVILGDAIAVDAVKNGRTNPWPEGARLAKVAFKPSAESSKFVQVELMKKESSEWSWARWVGDDLEPYGEDASFASECRNCHEPMRSRDFVYSVPQAGWDPAWGKITSLRIDQGSFHVTANQPLAWSQIDDPNWYGARISHAPPVVESPPAR